MAERLFLEWVSTPIGELLLVTDVEGRLRATHFGDHEDELRRRLRRRTAATELASPPRATRAAAAVAAYFAGDVRAIDALPVETGGTPFQRAVWAALREIPCGTTVSYGEIARRIGRPKAVRAVGMANNANPVGVVVPCHRVIGAGGDLTGYGGGLDRKRWLLDHEARCVSAEHRGRSDAPAPMPLPRVPRRVLSAT
jgi:methylated-DNA-[protein]-cysteine S-methyltransferase